MFIVTMFIRKRAFLSTIIGFTTLAVGAVPTAFAIEQLAVGDSVRIACENAPVYGQPSAFGVPSAGIAFGETVRINALEGAFELPDSDFKSKKKLEQQAKNMAGEGTPREIEAEEYTRYSWADVGSSRFVPTSCLVSEKNFGDQTIERAEEKVADLASGKAKRNFSEDEEEGDLRAVRGAAGGAKGGAADYDKIDRLIGHAQGVYDPSSLMAFRKAGGLGEYK
jgi:hypothetical protein